MNLTDFLSPVKWLEFDMDFYDRSGMNAYAFDSVGDRIAGHKKWANQLCPVIKGNPGKAKNICGLSHQHMAHVAKEQRRIVISECEAGLLKICVPVIVDDEFVGIVGGCGLLAEDGEVESEVVSLVTGMDESVVTRFAGNIRRVPKQEIEEHAHYLEKRVQELTARKAKASHPKIKSFRDLQEEVLKPGLCHQCGGCVTFCTAINYGALELGETGRPRFRDPDKCIQCGVCYMICPSVGILDEEVKQKMQWVSPMGYVSSIAVVRARDPEIRKRATDGGAVTAILTHLLEQGKIDGAVVTMQAGPLKRMPWLATTREEIVDSAGSHFDRSHSGAATMYQEPGYSSYSPSVQALGPVIQKDLKRVAVVGTPCQIKTISKMDTLGVVPSDSIACTLGLFCSGNYIFDDRRREKIERIGDFKWSDVDKINIKDELIIQLKDGDYRTLPLEEMEFVKRQACNYCQDYSSEFSDISFGGLGAEDGWTTVVARTPNGESILQEARKTVLEDHPGMNEQMMEAIREKVEVRSGRKRDNAVAKRQELLESAGK